MDSAELTKRIIAITTDPNLTETEKAIKRQALLSGGCKVPADGEGNDLQPLYKASVNLLTYLLNIFPANLR
jgi:hypothetical protein